MTPELNEKIWLNFIAWLPSAPPSDNPLTLMQAYRDTLFAAGLSREDIHGHLDTIKREMRVRTDGWRAIFNNIFTAGGGGFSTAPNALLVSAIVGRRAGRALDAGMGQGRNSLFLARSGWEVTGFDVSDEGLAAARRNASEAGLKIAAIQCGESGFDYGAAHWDLMVFTYVPFRVEDPGFAARLGNALRPGGIVVVESFASETTSAGRRPVDIDPAALRTAFAGFRILHFDDVSGTPEWTREPARLVRMIAERPA
ncbi:MAG: class I SAM-dependent methyltransferase [Bryobacterales bacterium]|nr:class I SAM-dependent methyltransferase [Bryobacterales bacterium]